MPSSQSIAITSKAKHSESILHAMITARIIDELEREYTSRGEAFFHASGAGHEGVAALEPHLNSHDYIHAHYRDKALLLARGLTPYEYFLALFDKDASFSKGRQLNAHVIVKAHKILSIAGPLANNAPQSAGIAAHLKACTRSGNYPITVCGVGDGTTQEGEFLEALTLSIIDTLPVLFLIEDNKFAISTPTEGKTFYHVGDKKLDEFMGVPITRVDGRNPHEAYEAFAEVTADMRSTGRARIVVFSVERLASHSNADDHKIYRSIEEITHLEDSSDPIVNYLMHLHDECRADAKTRLETLCNEMRPTLRKLAQKAQREANPQTVFSSKAALPSTVHEKAREPYESGDATMIEAMNEVLSAWLEKDSRVFLYGQDIEDPKGDVFGLTKGLSTKFNGRVVNSPLSESFIVGTAIGRALAGGRPVAFLQFADFLPLAFNQIYAELGSMYWRTGGTWAVPVIILATCGGYRPGLGPFHASVMESFTTHVPGLDVVMPSNAADAAGLLNAAFFSERPTIFFYPKSRLNSPEKTISKRSARRYVVVPGTADRIREGDDITIVGYGNTVVLCEKVADSLAQAGKHADVIDLRSMSPLDDATIRESVKRTGRLLIAHEDTRSVSISSEIIARVVEDATLKPHAIERVTRSDTYVPCNFQNQLEVLPSYKRILEAAVRLLDGTVTWQVSSKKEDAFAHIRAVGISPSDEHLTIMKWNIAEGDSISEGDFIAEGEADKSACDIRASISGKVEKLCVAEGDMIAIGEPIVRVQVDSAAHDVVHTVTKEESGKADIVFSSTEEEHIRSVSPREKKSNDIYVSRIQTVLGTRTVDNTELVSLSPDWTEDKIIASTGIRSRHWVGENQTVVSMATEAARKTLSDAKLSLRNIDGIICATGTHQYQSPSLAAMVQYELVKDISDDSFAYTGYAYDVSAACSGYVFALSAAYHRVFHNPSEVVLVLTSEVLSPRIDMFDYGTAPVFSDAASASIVASDSFFVHTAHEDNTSRGLLFRPPLLQTLGEPATDLVVPECGTIHMNGIKVYKVAVTHLTSIARKVCERHAINLDEVDLIVPHQANAKIIHGVARRLQMPLEKFYSSIDKHGNSSSNTIPICLRELEDKGMLAGKKVLLIAFGSGYTFGGTLLDYS